MRTWSSRWAPRGSSASAAVSPCACSLPVVVSAMKVVFKCRLANRRRALQRALESAGKAKAELDEGRSHLALDGAAQTTLGHLTQQGPQVRSGGRGPTRHGDRS